MHFDRTSFSDETLAAFYKALLYPRLVEEKMLHLLRQGKVGKWFSGIGQEAIAVGATLGMDDREWILPLHRNLGVFTARGLPLEKLFLQWQGNAGGYTKGRDRSFHFGSRKHHICGMISHLGPQLSVADGIALAHKLRGENKATLVFTGEGGTSEGEFHEALNLAAVWDLPVIFLIENNGYALSTPVSEQYRCERLSDHAKGYGIEGHTIDGNNILAVYRTVSEARAFCLREQKPLLIECMTFRMRGHEEASGIHYVPPSLLEEWKERDPLDNFERFLSGGDILSPAQVQEIKETLNRQISETLDKAHLSQNNSFLPEDEPGDVYAPLPVETVPGPAWTATPVKEERFVDALTEGLDEAMQKHENLLLMGQDIGTYGGAFKVTKGLLEKFGKDRVRDTPLCESAVLGAALGLSLEGYKSVVEMQFSDFITCGFNQVVNNLAKIHYRWGAPADVVIRMPCGGGVGAGPFHSQTNEAWFAHCPGLKIVYPSSPADAKSLLLGAIEDPNPVLFFEHKALYRSLADFVPVGYCPAPLGRARIIQDGEEAVIITYGMGVHWAMTYAKKHPQSSLCILDIRTLLPLDTAMIYACVKKTGKVCVLHEASLTGGFGAELSALITEHCFEWLDAPVMRCASLDTPVPFAKKLEDHYLAECRLEGTMKRLLAY